MIYTQSNNFLEDSTINGRWNLLGLDVGGKKVGVAHASNMVNVVLPITVIINKRQTVQLEEICKIISAREITGIVIGWPLEMSGNAGVQTENISKFAGKLLLRRDIPVYLQDERMSTALANRLLMDASLTRRQRSDVDDQLSAAIILESFLLSVK